MTTPAQDDLPVVPLRHPGRWVAAAVVLVLVAMFVHWLVATEALHWGVVGHYLFEPVILTAVRRTIVLTIIAMVIGIVLGVVLAVMRLSPNPVLSGSAWTYIWFFRGTPVLVQLLFWYNLPAVLHSLSVGVPFGPSWFHTDPKTIITQFGAAILGLGLNEAAYMAEIARAGILSVDEGQTEAAQALGMTRAKTMQRIVLPQAMRVIIPPTGNETISMLKTTSLVFAIGYTELLTTVQIIYGRTFETIPLLIVASIWYIFMTTVLSVGQYYLERYYARGSLRGLPPTPFQRVRARLGRGRDVNAGLQPVLLSTGQEHR
ncbi:MAG TPA: amino acid ABC transporter permease [Mycobacteriales bacterium]|jgi:polar amino acid transport system permease protein|nr:amino acid ABC transporter permease [Mycobacteriales bacterium]